jgi:DNA repair exonuclease SbcCD ATPase subunit
MPNKKKKAPFAAYCGSTVQQNFGESVDGHGYLLWDLNEGTVTEVDIPNNYAFINVYIEPGTDYDNLNIPITPKPYTQIKVHWSGLPSEINQVNTAKIKKYFREMYAIRDVKFHRKPLNTTLSIDGTDERLDNITTESTQAEILVDYLKKLGYDKPTIAEVLKIHEAISERLSGKLQDREAVEWRLVSSWLENFKSHGDRLDIDWSDTHGLWQIMGKNERGKSNIFDSLMYTWFGKTLGTRKGREKFGDARFINNKRDLDYCAAGNTIEVNGRFFKLERRTERTWNRKKTEVTGCSTTFTYFEVDESGVVIESESEDRKKATEKLLQSVIGDFDAFLRSSFINADTLNELLSIDHSVFVDAVLRDLGLDIFEQLLDEFKKWIKEKHSKEYRIVTNISENEETIDACRTEIDNLKDLVLTKESEAKEIEKNGKSAAKLKDGYLKKIHPISDEIKNTNPDKLRADIQVLLDQKEAKTEDLRQFEAAINSMKGDYDKSRLEELVSLKEGFNTWLYERKNEIKKNEYDYITTENQIAMINGDIELINRELKLIESSIKGEVANLEAQAENIRKEISILESSKTCPTCNREKDGTTLVSIQQTIADKHATIEHILNVEKERVLAEARDRYKAKREEIPVKEESKTPYQETLTQITDNIAEIRKAIDAENIRIEGYALEIKQINLDKEEVEKRTALMNQANIIPTQIELIESKIEVIKGKIQEYEMTLSKIQANEKLEVSIAAVDEKITTLRNEYETVRNQINHINNVQINDQVRKIADLETLNQKFKDQEQRDLIHKIYEKAIHRDGLPTIILKRSLDTINAELANLLETVNFTVFINEDLKMKMYDYNNEKAVINVIEGSGMQKTFASLALRLALRKINNSSRSSMLLLDEVFGKLDGDNVVLFVDLLDQIKNEIELLVVVEHAYADIINPDALISVDIDNIGVSFVNIN